VDTYIYMVLGFVMGAVAGVGIGCLLSERIDKRRERQAREAYNHIRTAFSPPERPDAKKP
jgi:membrane protein YqaA with SNARE-associated domain